MTKTASPLRLARLARGMTVRQLHAATGISTGRLSMLERQMVHANPPERQRLAAALGTEGAQLFADAAIGKGQAS